MLHDESIYPDADSFKPERFFTKEGALNDDEFGIIFGFGRRSLIILGLCFYR